MKIFGKLNHDKSGSSYSFKYRLGFHMANASTIITNRLHSAIIGAILGKNVELFRNSYHKNRSVWEYSLQSKGVKWIE